MDYIYPLLALIFLIILGLLKLANAVIFEIRNPDHGPVRGYGPYRGDGPIDLTHMQVSPYEERK